MKRFLAIVLAMAMVLALVPAVSLADSAHCTSITIESDPTNKTYKDGDSFDKTGMKIVAHFNNAGDKDVTDEVTYKSKLVQSQTDITFTYTETYEDDDGNEQYNQKQATYTGLTVGAGSTTAVAAISLSDVSLTIPVGGSATLTATIAPTEAAEDVLSWGSSDAAVATTSFPKTGVYTVIKIEALKAGKTVITVKDSGSHTSASCLVTVPDPVDVKKIAFSNPSMEVIVGEGTDLTLTMTPSNAVYKSIVWTSSNPKYVTVDANGFIKAIKKGGSSTITATVTQMDGSTTLSAGIVVKAVETLSSNGTIVNCNKRINIRKSASGSSQSMGYAYKGQSVVIAGQSGSWYKISKIGNEKQNPNVYIYHTYVSTTGKKYTNTAGGSSATSAPTNTSTNTGTSSKVTIINCVRRINVRKSANGTSTLLGTASLGSSYKLMGRSGDWYAIQYGSQVGYVWYSYCKLS